MRTKKQQQQTKIKLRNYMLERDYETFVALNLNSDPSFTLFEIRYFSDESCFHDKCRQQRTSIDWCKFESFIVFLHSIFLFSLPCIFNFSCEYSREDTSFLYSKNAQKKCFCSNIFRFFAGMSNLPTSIISE